MLTKQKRPPVVTGGLFTQPIINQFTKQNENFEKYYTKNT